MIFEPASAEVAEAAIVTVEALLAADVISTADVFELFFSVKVTLPYLPATGVIVQ